MVSILDMIISISALAVMFSCGLYCGYLKNDAKIYVVFLHIMLASGLSFCAIM